MKSLLLETLRERVLFYDGAMGTQLQAANLTAADFGGKEGCNDFLSVTRPDVVEAVHAAYFEAGADVVETNSFQASRLRFEEWGIADRTLEINRDITDQKLLEEQRGELARERAAMQEEVIQRQREQLHEMATPFIPITDRIMVMPLIGTIDSDRARQVMETALIGSASRRAQMVILDVTGMTHLDTSVAGALISTANALRLLGTGMVLTGIRPDLAQTLVSAGVDLGAIVTASTLQSGIAYAMKKTGHALGAAR